MSDGQTVVRAREPLAMQAARVSWMIPIVVGGLNVMYSSANKAPGSFSDWGARWGQLVVSGFSMAALLAGVVCAAGALIGLRGREAGGRKAEAVAGLAINGLMVLAFVVAVLIGAALTGMRHRPVDHSLAAADYEARGMPTAELPWQGEDYARAVAAFKSVAATDANSLPRWKSARSGEVFARLTDPSNFVEDQATLAGQLQRSAQISVQLQPLTKVYTDAMRHGAVYDDELVEVGGFGLKLMTRMLRDIDALMASLPAEDPMRARVLAAHGQMTQGVVDVLEGTIDILGEKAVTGTACQVRLAGYARDTFPEILKKVPASERAAAVARVERLRDGASGDYRAALAELARVMEAER